MATPVYTISLKKDADFWEDELTVTDDTGALVTFTNVFLTIHPSEGADIVWNVANGKLLMPSAGVIKFLILKAEIAAYVWKKGTYCISVEYTNGRIDGSWLKGVVTVADVCQ